MCTATATLAPFDFAVPPLDHRLELTGFSDGSRQRDPTHFVLNMLLFVPLGALVHHRRRRAVKLLAIAIIAGAAAFLISFGIECLQHLLRGRESSLVDVTANTAGALLGVFANRAGGAELAARIDELRASASPIVLAAALMSLMVVSLVVSGRLQALTRLSNWSPDYTLLVGNERTGDRPWRGTVFSLEITDAATPVSLIRRFAVGESVLLRGAPVARFEFTGSGPYRDDVGNVADLDWTAQPGESLEGSVAMTGRRWLQSHVPPKHLVRRLRQTNAFTLRVTCSTSDPAQTGPARIVSNSASPSLRNFTVGQQGADLVVRVRTPLTGPNGTRAETVVPDVFASDQPRDILIAYDGTALVAAVASSNLIVRTELSPGLNAALVLNPDSANVPQRQQLYKLGYLAVLFLPPAVLIGLFSRARRDRVMFSIVYVFTAAIAIEGTLMLAGGRAFDLWNACVTAGAGAVVLTVFGVTLSARDVRSSIGHPRAMRKHAIG
jgi:VanZ like family